MKKTSPEIVGFEFQEIPLEEAQHVVLAGDGNYSEIKTTLLEKLPSLAPDKAFAFGLPGEKEVPEDQRRGLCMSINGTLKKAKMNWSITYSSARRMFICVPKNRIKPETKTETAAPGYKYRSKYNDTSEMDRVILDLKSKGLSANKIIEQTKFPAGHVRYVSYNKVCDQKRREKIEQNGKTNGHEPGQMSASQLVEIARNVFNFRGDLTAKTGQPMKNIRKAISKVGVLDLKISPKELAPLLGVKCDAVYFLAHYSKSSNGIKEVKTLQKAVQ